MGRDQTIIKDIANVQDRFPKLKSRWNSKHEVWILEGDFDICDTKGFYWDTFVIAILLDKKYPFSVPVVVEKSEKIPRNIDRHISESGLCCLDIEHNLLRMAQKGIILSDFIERKVYPYFANQLYFEQEGCYAGEEYAHRFEGVKQFYEQDLKISSIDLAICFIEGILSNRNPARNALCTCGSGIKFKKCHLSSVEFLKQVGRDQLNKDLSGFIELRKELPSDDGHMSQKIL